MRDSGRMAAAIQVLADMDAHHKPARLALKAWGEASRHAGAKDRAFVSGLVLDGLRRRRSLEWRIGETGPRAAVLAALRYDWDWPAERIAEAAAEPPHGPGALSDEEARRLAAPRILDEAASDVRGDYPGWLEPLFERAFGDRRAQELAALSHRAPVDLRVNRLKTDVARALKALEPLGVAPAGLMTCALRASPPAAAERAAPVESAPEFEKGWFEVQDLGSQIAAAAAGEIKGRQVLDFCAGGGGKTLALAAAMGNSGQLYAYDADARRLSDTVRRSQRAGVRNLQVKSPLHADALAGLEQKMDVVFVDAPCTGSGTWRRHPDAKWRLRPGQLEQRQVEQDEVLAAAGAFVKPGGRLVYVTCSLLMEENQDRIAAFLAAHPEFAVTSALDQIAVSGQVEADGLALLSDQRTPEGFLRLTPLTVGTDGFFVAVLERQP
ncbi:MAG TPA: RsmB/NOP family class I SAM-dependent RNA methyltransferase [Caulobacteraceae bacterium]|nr:RsmB/NOP family class I SAM-dependent RNA methyltransferase [Caulobacteraceae bacterium]